MTSRPTAITGYSLVNGAGADRDAVRDALYAGRRGLSACALELPFEATTGSVDIALAPLEGALAPWDTRITRLAQHLVRALEAELERLRARWSKERVAVILGTTTAGADCTEAAYKHYLEHGALPDGYDLWRHHTYGAVLYVTRTLCGAEGPSYVV